MIRTLCLTTLVFLFLNVAIQAHSIPRHRTAKVTFYAPRYNGRKTALGERYSDTLMTCATSSKFYLGKTIRFVSNCGDTLKLRCNDLMAPYKELRFDFSRRAFLAFNDNSLKSGVLKRVSFYVVADSSMD